MELELLRRIELYLRRNGITATRFGYEALNDPCFVFELRNGRQLRERTAERVARWLDSRDSGRS